MFVSYFSLQKNHRKPDQNNNQSSGESAASNNGETSSLNGICDEVTKMNINENDECVYEIKNSTVIGRYVVAGKDLRPTDVVMKVAPIVLGPCTDTDPVCLGCYMPIIPGRIKYKYDIFKLIV